MKILILVLSYDDSNVYTKFYEAQKKTWEEIKKIQLNDELYHKIWNSFDPNKLTINYFIK